MNRVEKALAHVPPGERVLLLPHCLRPSQTCPGRPSRDGFQCPSDCRESCSIRVLREEAVRLGYKGVCIAPGGALAARFVEETAPRAVVAIACRKELEEGVQAVRKRRRGPQVVAIPLLRDGCVDTEVDLAEALAALRSSASADLPQEESVERGVATLAGSLATRAEGRPREGGGKRRGPSGEGR